MKIEQLCQSLKEYFSQFSLVRVLMPIASILLYVLAGLRVLSYFFSLGALVEVLAYVCYFVALLLVLCNCRFRDLSIGTGILAVLNVIDLLTSLFKYRYLDYYALVYLLLYGLATLLAYKKSLKFN